MGSSRQYKELIFTNHALDRLAQRRVDQSEAWATWRRPDKRYYAATKQAWVFQRSWRHRQIELVAKQNERKEWVVLSVWSNYVHHKPKQSWLMKLLRRLWRWIIRI
jgi:hypothetical protein